MITTLLEPDKDPMGAAIAAFHNTGRAGKLHVFSSMFYRDEIPVRRLFRDYTGMPKIEQVALQFAKGAILDVGAGSGCHSLALRQMGKEATPIDISALSVEVMRQRGLENARQENLFSPQFTGQFDTILMLMNGAGIIGKIDYLSVFFQKLKQILAPEGSVLLDSSDLRYLFEEEDGGFTINLNANYYGEVDFRMQYEEVKGEKFDWLYIDFQTLAYHASQYGFVARLITEGAHYDYLAEIKFRD